MATKFNAQRAILAGVAIIAVLAVAGTVALRQFWPPASQSGTAVNRDGEAPVIAIATTDNLETIIAAIEAARENDARAAGEDAAADAAGSARAKPFAPARADAAEPASARASASASASGAAPAQGVADLFNTQEGQQAIVNIYADGMAGELAGFFTRTERFNVAEPSRMYTAFNQLVVNGPEPRQAARSIAEKLAATFSRDEEDDRPVADVGVSASALGADFVEIARREDFDYVLILDLAEPNVTTEAVDIAYSVEQRYRVRANPTFVYLLYDVRRDGIVVVSDQARLSESLVVELTAEMLANLTGQEAVAILTELNLDQFSRISTLIAGAVVNAVYPPAVLDVGDGQSVIVLNRGSVDGVAVGEELAVYRTERLRDQNNVWIEGPRQHVSTVRIVQADRNVSVAERLEDADIQRGDSFAFDVALRLDDPALTPGQSGVPAGLTGGQQTANLASPGGGGRQALGVAGADAAADRARVAISDFEFSIEGAAAGDLQTIEDELQRAFIRMMESDNRFLVLSRQDLERVQEEYRLSRQNDLSTRGVSAAPVDAAAYLVTGSVRIDSGSASRSASLGGQTRALGSTYTLYASGELSVIGMDSSVIAAERVELSQQVSGNGGDARAWSGLAADIAEQGARLLRAEIYPLTVSQVAASGLVAVNAGGDVLSVGQRLRVYRSGEPVIDPDTGVVLSAGGRELVGALRVVDTDDRVSYAEISGDAFTPARGDRIEIDGAASAPGAAAAPQPAAQPAAPQRDRPF